METEKAAFMGKITAGVTHEIKNVLAIIKESAGLLEDLVVLAKDNAPPPREKFLRTLGRIGEQVVRGVDLASSLNAFAHTADEPFVSVDLNRTVDQVAFLCQRFARLKHMTLDATPHEKTLVLSTDPLAFQMLLFRCVDLVMRLGEPGTVITLKPSDNDGNGILISSTAQKTPPHADASVTSEGSHEWQDMLATAAALGLSIEAGGPPAWIAVRPRPSRG